MVQIVSPSRILGAEAARPAKYLQKVERHKLVEPLSAQAVLGEKVGRILFSKHLAEIDSAGANGLLDPQRVGVKVPQFA